MSDIFDELKEEKLIYPGSVLSIDVLEKKFNISKDDPGYIWKKLELKERIKMDGYFVTDKGCEEGAFLILKSEDMADYANQKLVKNKNSNEKVALILKAHDISSLNEQQKKKHLFAQQRAAKCASSMGLELLKAEVW